MKSKFWLMSILLSSLFVAPECFAENEASDDDEYEEVVVRRKKKRKSKAKAAAPVAVAPAAAVVVPATVVVPVAVPSVAVDSEKEEVAEEPPPEPPKADAAEPRRLVRYFCKAWKDQDYERLWWAMSPKYRKKVSLKKFTKLFESDAELNGGLLDENILEVGKTRNGNDAVKVELIFKFPRAKHRFVMATVERQPGGLFRVVDSPFIPKDLDDL
jgi:hypothetical protein